MTPENLELLSLRISDLHCKNPREQNFAELIMPTLKGFIGREGFDSDILRLFNAVQGNGFFYFAGNELSCTVTPGVSHFYIRDHNGELVYEGNNFHLAVDRFLYEA